MPWPIVRRARPTGQAGMMISSARAGDSIETCTTCHCGFGGADMDLMQKRYADTVVLSAVGDRKSTRLNSSHSQISYAVFCLKKKKKRQKNRAVLTTRTP